MLKSIKSAVLLMMLTHLAFANVDVVDSLSSPREWIQQQYEQAQNILDNGNEPTNAITIFKSAIDFSKSQNLANEFPELLIGYGLALYKKGDFQNSYSTLLELLPQIEQFDPKKKAKIFQILGMNLVFQDKFSEGYKYQMDALKYYSDIKDSIGLMSVYYDIGANFGGQEQYQIGLGNYEKGIEIAKSIGDPKMIILGTTALGGAWASLKNYEKALSYSSESIQLAKSLNDDEELAWASINRGYILGLIEKYAESEKYLNKAYDLSFKIQNQLLTAYALEQLSDINIKQNKLTKALKALDESYELYNEIGQSYSIKMVVKKYAEIYYKKRDFDKYKYYTDQYIAIKDSIYSKEMLESMASLKQDFEIHTLERDNHIALLKKDQELKDAQNNVVIAGVVGAAGILMLLLTLMYNRNKAATEKNDILSAKNLEILRQNEFLASSNRDLEKYAYIISHDLKEPLRNINGFTKLLTRKLKDYNVDSEVNEYAKFITNGTQQMEELLSGLLAYSKVSANKSDKEKLDAMETVEKVVDSLKIQIEDKNCVVDIQALPPIHYRKTQLTQVVQNLVANAIKFGPEAGNRITIGFEEREKEFVFYVRDEGIGIDSEYQKEIFVVFQRLHNRATYSGSGIGLATCKKIVEDHGGRIWVESKKGEGSCFFFTIPKIQHQPKEQVNSKIAEPVEEKELVY